jgi:hypothetical protein
MYGKKENISAMVLHNLTGKLLDEVQAHIPMQKEMQQPFMKRLSIVSHS